METEISIMYPEIILYSVIASIKTIILHILSYVYSPSIVFLSFSDSTGIKYLYGIRKKETKIIEIIYRVVILVTINFLWILFRNDTKQSIKLLLKMFGLNFRLFTNSGYQAISKMDLLWFYVDTKFFIIISIAILFSFPWWEKIKLPQNTHFLHIYPNL